ncbi:MAG: SDR family oxidoreductase, partial [Nocardia sp.]|nr:SDR family oxidoreductase [Nocardia sp.]
VVADVIALDQYDAPAVALLGVRMPVTSRDRCSTVSSGTAQAAANGTDVASVGLRIPFPGPVRRRRYDPTVATTPGWAASIPRVEQWIPAAAVPDLGTPAAITRAVIIGDCELATELGAALSVHVPVQRIALSHKVTDMPAGFDTSAPVIVVWPDSPVLDPVPAAGRALRILQQARTAPRSVIVVLRDRAGLAQSAVAAMVRTAQTESAHPIRLIWSDGFSPAVLGEAILDRSADEELAIEHTTILRRGFVPAPTSDGAGVAIAADGTYVVTGALDGLGAVAARWLLDRGARDIVLLTAIPRPLPPLLDGCEDRVVVMHCDIADPADLDTALTDIRACGSTIRGLIHTDGPAPVTDTPLIETPPNETFTEVSADQVIQRIEAARSAIGALLAATACDGLDFTLLFSSMAAALGVPGRTGAAAAHSVLDTMARTSGERRVTSIAWGSWDYGLTRSDDAAARMRSAGITAFDAARGMAVLSAVLQRPEPVLLAVDYHPGEYTSADSSGDTARLARRLRQLWQAATPELSVTAD